MMKVNAGTLSVDQAILQLHELEKHAGGSILRHHYPDPAPRALLPSRPLAAAALSHY
jgi:hypothetical protein